MLRDVRYALRTLAKQPAFTALAVVTFALGIGANTAIFTVANATLRRALPFVDSDRLYWVVETRKAAGVDELDVSYPDFQDWERQSKAFSALAAHSEDGLTIRKGEGSALEVVASVTPRFFNVLGVAAARGRTFEPGDEKPTAPSIVLCTHAYWQTQLGGDANVIGRTLTLDNKPYTIVGVLPRGYAYGPLDNLGLYVPMRPEGGQRDRRNLHWMAVIGRLAPGATAETAEAEVSGISGQLAAAYPATNAGTGAHLVPLSKIIVGKVEPIMLVLLVAVALLLLIACANVANLALARATARRRELAIRAALGASRGRLIGQLALESVITALAGGALGVVLAMWGVDALISLIPERTLNATPWLIGLTIDAGALAFATVLALVVGVAVGIVPGFVASRQDLQQVLGEEARGTAGRGRARLSDVIVGAEVALAFMLLVGAALFGRSLVAMITVDPGLDTRNALTVRVVLATETRKEDAQIAAGHAELLRRLEALPGVTAAASVTTLPLIGRNNTIRFVVDGRPEAGRDVDEEANIRSASTNYFAVARVPLRAGRFFQPTDIEGALKVMIVNQALASKVFPGEDPIGKSLVFTYKSGLPPIRIVGVVGDQRTTLDEPPPPALFLPEDQDTNAFTTLFIRTAGNPAAMAPRVQAEIARFDPEVAVLDILSMDERVSRSPYVFVRRFPAILIGAFAALALVLSVVGLYGVLTYTVGQRTHEIGIRRAVGADGQHIARLVLGRALAVVGGGLVVGVVVALGATTLLRSMLFGIGAHDPATFAGTAVLLLVVAIVACGPPIRRALRVDPMEALRSQ